MREYLKQVNKKPAIEIIESNPPRTKLPWNRAGYREADSQTQQLVKERWGQQRGEKIIANKNRLAIVTPQGVKMGMEQYKKTATRLKILLEKAGQKSGRILPFGSLANKVWVGGSRKLGFWLDIETLNPLPFQSDIDIQIVLPGRMTPKLRKFIEGEDVSPLSSQFSDITNQIKNQELDLWIVEELEKGEFIHRVFPK